MDKVIAIYTGIILGCEVTHGILTRDTSVLVKEINTVVSSNLRQHTINVRGVGIKLYFTRDMYCEIITTSGERILYSVNKTKNEIKFQVDTKEYVFRYCNKHLVCLSYDDNVLKAVTVLKVKVLGERHLQINTTTSTTLEKLESTTETATDKLDIELAMYLSVTENNQPKEFICNNIVSVVSAEGRVIVFDCNDEHCVVCGRAVNEQDLELSFQKDVRCIIVHPIFPDETGADVIFYTDGTLDSRPILVRYKSSTELSLTVGHHDTILQMDYTNSGVRFVIK